MSLAIKPHLPLITSRIEFKLNKLPPPPLITTRRDLSAQIRRQTRHNSVPYSRPPSRVRVEIPARAQSVGIHLRSESPLSELSDDDDDDDDEGKGISTPTKVPKIPKPPGEAGRKNSGGYNLQEALHWDDDKYGGFCKYINEVVDKKLDPKTCYSKQEPRARKEAILIIICRFDLQDIYEDDWPVRDGLKLRLKNTTDLEKRKVTKNATVTLRKAVISANNRLRSAGGSGEGSS